MKINSKRELQNTAFEHSEDIDYKGFCRNLQRMYKRAFQFFDN